MNESTARNTVRLSIAASLLIAAIGGTIHAVRADYAADRDAAIVAGGKLEAAKFKTLLDGMAGRIAALEGSAVIAPGTVVAFAGTAAPSGWLLCDGAAVSRTTYAKLFTALGSSHGSGDGTTTFNLPDYRGRFLRGVDGAAGRDPDKATRTASKPGGNTGDNVGSVEVDAFASHRHNVEMGTGGGGSCGTSFKAFLPSASIFASSVGACGADLGSPLTLSGGSETRPINVSVNYIIKN